MGEISRGINRMYVELDNFDRRVDGRGNRMPMTARKVWREGVAPLLTMPQLEALMRALERDDARLIQGYTTEPPRLCVFDYPCKGGCLISYPYAFEDETERTVGDVEEFFGQMCREVDRVLGEAGAIRYLLNAYDAMPRDEMRRVMLGEVELELRKRKEDGR